MNSPQARPGSRSPEGAVGSAARPRAAEMPPIQVGLIGLGAVGTGTFEVLRRNQDEIRRRAGRGIEMRMVVAPRHGQGARDRRRRGRSRG